MVTYLIACYYNRLGNEDDTELVRLIFLQNNYACIRLGHQREEKSLLTYRESTRIKAITIRIINIPLTSAILTIL